MPSKFNQACSSPPSDTLNSFRYHHGPLNAALVERSLRFSATNGSGYTLSSTKVPATVEGTVAAYQWSGLNLSVEITAPDSGTCSADWIVQPSDKKIFSVESAWAVTWKQPTIVAKTRQSVLNRFIMRILGRRFGPP